MLTVRRSRLASVRRNPTVGRSLIFWILSLILMHKGWLVDNRATLYRLQTWCLLTEQYAQHHFCACWGTLSRFPRQHYLPFAKPYTPQKYQIVDDRERCPSRNSPGMNKLHCMSRNRLNRVDSELISYMKVDSGLTPAREPSLNKYPKNRF